MRKFYSGVVKYRKLILIVFIAAAIVCGGLKELVAVMKQVVFVSLD